ncbi:MAG: glycosyltransferase family 4 protein [Ramlibacter sp.]|nr:glycosyltransferase family 4 protein [Ramlibacter sp.]
MTQTDVPLRRKICFVATSANSLNVFMRPHIEALGQEFDIMLVATGDPQALQDLLGDNIKFRSLAIEREVSLLRDVRALWSLFWLFRELRPQAVHSIMPKSGLLTMLAARFAGVPSGFHTFTGQVWATRRGFWRHLLKLMDKVLVLASSRVLADSPSQAEFLASEGILPPGGAVVLGAGSICGVDIRRFSADKRIREHLRGLYAVPHEAVVFIYVGRLNRDKGVLDLLEAFATIAAARPAAQLLLVGPDEEKLAVRIDQLAGRFPGRVHRQGFSLTPEHYMTMADVFCLPSYREGFGSTLIEAAAVGLPSLASRIYGITDAVVDDVTGLLHAPGDVNALSGLMLRILDDPGLRARLGSEGRRRATESFSQERLTAAMAAFYRENVS